MATTASSNTGVVNSPAVEAAFERAVNRFKISLDDEVRAEFDKITTEADVRNLLEQMEVDQGNRKSLRNARRLEPFLNFMSQYSKVIEVFLGAKQDLLALIWGPMKLLLQIASSFATALESLFAAFERIGENAPRFRRYAEVFRNSERMQHVIALMYEDILQFYRRAIKIFRRRAWAIIFSLSWADFETRFRQLLNNMQRHQQLIDNEAQAEAINAAQIAREADQEALEEKLKERLARKRKECGIWLASADASSLKDEAVQKRTRGTGRWLLNSIELNEIFNGKAHIWLHGKPGAGKTFLSASVIERLESRDDPVNKTVPILYFFCSYKNPDKNTCLAILRTLLWQLILNDDELVPYIYDQYTRGPQPPERNRCQVMLTTAIEAATKTGERLYIVIDGLDELPVAERKLFAPILKKFLSEKPLSEAISMFVASQDLDDIRKTMSTKYRGCLKIHSMHIGKRNTDDIDLYIEQETEEYIDSFDEDELPESGVNLKEHIRTSLSAKAGGMFLYVRLVMEGLISQVSVNQIYKTLDDLPDGLEMAYERILDRISFLGPEHKEMTIRVLGWLTVATRQLTLRELEDACAIYLNPNHITVDPQERPAQSRLRNGCGPLVEVTGEDTIAFVHDSARRYLLDPQCRSTPFICELQAHREMALVCAVYLGFRCFHRNADAATVRAAVLNGDLRLNEYVQSSWMKHVLEAYKVGWDVSPSQLNELLLRYFDLHLSDLALKQIQTELEEITAPVMENKMPPRAQAATKIIFMYRQALQKKAGRYEVPENPSDFSICSNRVRQALEKMLGDLADDAPAEKLHKVYGQKLYKCRHPGCATVASEGFDSVMERQKHEDRHERPYRCSVESCTMDTHPSKQALQKHMKLYHQHFAPGKNRTLKGMNDLDAAMESADRPASVSTQSERKMPKPRLPRVPLSTENLARNSILQQSDIPSSPESEGSLIVRGWTVNKPPKYLGYTDQYLPRVRVQQPSYPGPAQHPASPGPLIDLSNNSGNKSHNQ